MPNATAHPLNPSPAPAVDPATWERLRQRPVALPTLPAGSPCPFALGRRVASSYGLAIGDGPAYAVGQGPDAVYSLYNGQHGDGLSYQRVLWLVSPTYRGPLLVRARQIDSSNVLRFRESVAAPLLADLKLAGAGGGAPAAPGWRFWMAYTMVSSPGCYAYQVDGIDFSETIAFQVVRERPDELTPLPSLRSLPDGLMVTSATTNGPDRVRLGLIGTQSLAMRIEVTSTSTAPLELSGPDVQRSATPHGLVLWQADAQQRPVVAVWDDGRYRYRLTLVDSAPGGWSQADLLRLVAAFAVSR